MDDTWEPADQVHTNELVKSYHAKYAKEEERNKNQQWTQIKATIRSLTICPPTTQPTSPPPLPLASLSTWTLLNCSQLGCQLRPQWFTDKNPSPSLWPLQPSPLSLVSCNSPPAQCALLLRDIGHWVEKSSFSSCKDWQELHKRIKKSAMTIRSSSKPSSSEEMSWPNVRHTQLTWK